MKTRNTARTILTIAVVAGLVGGVALTASAASLVGSVNKALRAAGIVVKGKNQMGWAEGVLMGHYTSYKQLVDAMKYHKGQGKSIPDSSKFTKAVIGGTSARNIYGEVVSMSAKAIAIKYKSGGKVVNKTFSLTKKQFDKAVARSIQPGSQVKIVTKGAVVIGNVINRAPAGLEGTYGNTKAGGGGGGGT